MASKTKVTRNRRRNKRKPNKENLKKYLKRIQENYQILRDLESTEEES